MTNYNPQYPPQHPPYGQPPYGQPPYGLPPGYAPQPAKSTNWALIIVLVCAVPVIALLIAILLPALSSARERANRVKCSVNLRSIGQSMVLYSYDNNGAFPDSMAYLVTKADLSPEQLVCPSTEHTKPSGTTEAQLEQSMASGCCSYIYLGKGMTRNSPAGRILAYEKDGNHHKDGMSVLFGDGSVQWLNAMQAAQVRSELQSGQNPPPSLSVRRSRY